MAGMYPDIPAPRLPFDRDGSAGFYIDTAGAIRQLTSAEMRDLNDESAANSFTLPYAGGSYYYLGYVFSEPMDLSGVHYLASRGGYSSDTPSLMQYSPDSTNGQNGTWTNSISIAISEAVASPTYRTAISSLALTSVKAVRFRISTSGFSSGPVYVRSMHYYGVRTATSDRLEFWHPTLDQPLAATPAHFDWGDRPRGTNASRQVRLKNISTGFTASTITVGMEALTDSASPTYVAQHTFSYNGGAYGPTCSVTSLAPGEISQLIDVSQVLDASAYVGAWAQRIYANAGSWA